VRRYSRGEEIETLILSVDPERERISLGVKQLDQDPFTDYTNVNDRGAVVTGKITEVEPKEAVIELAEEVSGLLKASEISIDRVEDARNILTVGEEIEVKIVSVDRKNRTIALSIKAKEMDTERQAVREHQRSEADRPSAATLGDLIKAQMDKSDE
jgi:small subunit ribosomal protein S1